MAQLGLHECEKIVRWAGESPPVGDECVGVPCWFDKIDRSGTKGKHLGQDVARHIGQIGGDE